MPVTIPALQQALNALGPIDCESLQIMSAATVAAQYYPQLDPSQPLLILDGRADLASSLRNTLLAAFPAAQPVQLVVNQRASGLQLAELLPSAEGVPSWSLYVSPLNLPATYEALQSVAAHLRAPEGCPWDRALTWSKLRATLIEEAYELLAALDENDTDKVSEELGDLLLQVAMQTQIATEEGLFRFPDVIARIVDKLVRRHPHVFGDVVVSSTEEVLSNWEAIKQEERSKIGAAASPLAGVPRGLPALAQADAYLERMSRISPVTVQATPWEQLAQLKAGDELTPEMLGDSLLALVGWARDRGVEAESALRQANARLAALVAAGYLD